jgi:hypothetical protein
MLCEYFSDTVGVQTGWKRCEFDGGKPGGFHST